MPTTGLTGQLSTEMKLRQDCVQADFERLINAGANKDALERVINHSLQIGIIMDKLNNIRIHDLLKREDSE